MNNDIDELEKEIERQETPLEEIERRKCEMKIAQARSKVIEEYLDSSTSDIKNEIDETEVIIRTVKDLKEFLSQFEDETIINFYDKKGKNRFFLDNLKVLSAASYYNDDKKRSCHYWYRYNGYRLSRIIYSNKN